MSVVADLARTRTKVIHRMPFRGDLWIYVDAGGMFVRADQLEQLAGLERWSTGEALFDVGDWTVIDGHDCYPLEVAIARCEAATAPAAREFLAWLRDVVDGTDDAALDLAQGLPAFIGSHTVAAAAQILSRDPEVSLGRQGLFAFMEQTGWISRGRTDWELTHVARRSGWLAVRNVPVPGRGRTPYPQVYVTPAGLAELQRLLTVNRRHAPPDPAPSPTLFD